MPCRIYFAEIHHNNIYCIIIIRQANVRMLTVQDLTDIFFHTNENVFDVACLLAGSCSCFRMNTILHYRTFFHNRRHLKCPFVLPIKPLSNFESVITHPASSPVATRSCNAVGIKSIDTHQWMRLSRRDGMSFLDDSSRRRLDGHNTIMQFRRNKIHRYTPIDAYFSQRHNVGYSRLQCFALDQIQRPQR